MNNIEKIAYQGSPGSYSEELLKKEFQNSQYLSCNSFGELVKNVSANNSYGLLPVENSIAGTVIEAYEELIDSDLKIFAEYIKKIDHSLIGLQGSNLNQINQVISHPQALQQCSNFIQENNFKISPVFDTAGSLIELEANQDMSIAAIAGIHFENNSKFEILKKNIANHSENFTRFVLIGNNEPDNNLIKNKYSSVLISDDKPGSLLKALNIFSDLNINLTKLESRPILGRPWEYKFYIDYELGEYDIQENLVVKIAEVSKEFKILGHYPKANI